MPCFDRQHSSFRILLCLTAVGLMAGCSDASPTGRASTELNGEAYYRTQLELLGIPREVIRELRDGFVVDGDVFISKSELDRRIAHRGTAVPHGGRHADQWLAGGGAVQTSKATSIKVDISQLGTAGGWADATRAAIAAWTGLDGTALGLVEQALYADIVVRFGTTTAQLCGNPNTIACASFPASGNPGRTIYVNDFYNSMSPDLKEYVMAHEIGHTIGLRHSNWQARGEPRSGATLLSFTPQTDAGSIMNGGSVSSFSGIPFYDAAAASWLYRTYFTVGSYSPSTGAVSWSSQGSGASYFVYYNRWTTQEDMGGNLYPYLETFDLGRTASLSMVLPDPYTGDDTCSNSVVVYAQLATGEIRILNITPTIPTCYY